VEFSVNSIYCFYNSQPQASWSRKNGQASPAVRRWGDLYIWMVYLHTDLDKWVYSSTTD
jgi:hypothetical protein